jgi:hypothetical protein
MPTYDVIAMKTEDQGIDKDGKEVLKAWGEFFVSNAALLEIEACSEWIKAQDNDEVKNKEKCLTALKRLQGKKPPPEMKGKKNRKRNQGQDDGMHVTVLEFVKVLVDHNFNLNSVSSINGEAFYLHVSKGSEKDDNEEEDDVDDEEEVDEDDDEEEDAVDGMCQGNSLPANFVDFPRMCALLSDVLKKKFKKMKKELKSIESCHDLFENGQPKKATIKIY